MIKIAIIIINFNTEKITIDCVKSLALLSSPAYFLDIYVIDNKSPRPESTEYVEKHLKDILINNAKIHFMKTSENLGFAGGNNVGIKQALADGAEYIMLLNSDTYVDEKLIKELLKEIDTNKNIGVVAPKIYFAPGYEFHKNRYKKEESGKVFWYAGGMMDWNNVIGHHRGVDEVDKGQFDKVEKTDFASGCCLFAKREVLEKIGILDEKYFLYYEESDLCERIKRDGYDILYVPKAVVWHKNAQSAGGSGSTLQDYFITRNRMIFGMQYAPSRTKFALIRESLKLLLAGRMWQKIGIRDFYIRKFGKGSYTI